MITAEIYKFAIQVEEITSYGVAWDFGLASANFKAKGDLSLMISTSSYKTAVSHRFHANLIRVSMEVNMQTYKVFFYENGIHHDH